MVIDYAGPDTNGRKIRCPSVQAVTPPEIKPSEVVFALSTTA